MSNIGNLTSKILKDAEVKRDNILAVAEEEKAKILNKKKDEAKTLEATMLEKAKSEAQTIKARVISSAEIKARNEKLQAKQTVIQEVFEKAVEELCKLGKDDYLAFIKNGVTSLAITGDENLILNAEGQKLVNDDFIKSINKELSSKGKAGNLKLSSTVGSFKGGFILEKNGIEINNTFEALVESMKEEMQLEVAKALFN